MLNIFNNSKVHKISYILVAVAFVMMMFKVEQISKERDAYFDYGSICTIEALYDIAVDENPNFSMDNIYLRTLTTRSSYEKGLQKWQWPKEQIIEN